MRGGGAPNLGRGPGVCARRDQRVLPLSPQSWLRWFKKRTGFWRIQAAQHLKRRASPGAVARNFAPAKLAVAGVAGLLFASVGEKRLMFSAWGRGGAGVWSQDLGRARQAAPKSRTGALVRRLFYTTLRISGCAQLGRVARNRPPRAQESACGVFWRVVSACVGAHFGFVRAADQGPLGYVTWRAAWGPHANRDISGATE